MNGDVPGSAVTGSSLPALTHLARTQASHVYGRGTSSCRSDGDPRKLPAPGRRDSRRPFSGPGARDRIPPARAALLS
jgi:hypothetical protein